MWWQEIAIIAIGYWLYSLGRNAIPEQASIAIRHGRVDPAPAGRSAPELRAVGQPLRRVARVARADHGLLLRDAALRHHASACWSGCSCSRPHIYRGARTVLFTTTLIALVGFSLYPLAPPRLLPGYDYIDTLIKFHTWGSLADPEIAAHSNQFAAMPSLHIGWALWCGIVGLHVRASAVGAHARPALPVLHAAGDHRHGQPLHRSTRSAARVVVVARRSASRRLLSGPRRVHAAVRRARLRTARPAAAATCVRRADRAPSAAELRTVSGA